MSFLKSDKFKEIVRIRTSLAEALELNSIEQQFQELLSSGQYADSAHFIYELIQNADDAISVNIIAASFLSIGIG